MDVFCGSSFDEEETPFLPGASQLLEDGLGHDSGAFVTPRKKPSRRKIMKQLKKALEKNDSLREQILQMQTDPAMDSEFQSNCSGTMREEQEASRNDSMLLSTMNSWTLGTLSVPECIPTNGEEEIDKKAFEDWKEVFSSSLQLVNASDEQTKFGLFKIKAGSKLREIFSTTASSSGMPCEITEPFSNAMARFNECFGSRTYLLAQRGKLMNMCQITSESSLQFVRRVCSAAKLCGYTDDEEMEAVVRVMTKGALDSRVRTLAHRNWVKQGSMKDLIDLIRDREVEKSNEEEFQRSHKAFGMASEAASVAAVFQRPNEMYRQRLPNFKQKKYMNNRREFGGQRGFFHGGRGRGANRMVPRGSSNFRATNCWRCGSVFRFSDRCPVSSKECHICGRIGHIARQYSQTREQSVQPNALKRRGDRYEEEPTSKIAILDKPIGEDNKVETSDTEAS